jgi:uncharacterized protein YlaI
MNTLVCSMCKAIKNSDDFPPSTRAKNRGYRSYYCRKCHGTFTRAYSKRTRAVNRIKDREQYALNNILDPEGSRTKRQKKRLQFVETHPDYFSVWFQTHRPSTLAAEKRYAVKNPDKIKAKRRRGALLRNARKRGLPSAFSLAEEAFCRAYFDYACAACGNEEGFQWTISLDHWIPLSSPECPGTVASNIIPLCNGVGGCNTRKQGKDPETWLLARFGPRKARQILAKINAYFAVVLARQEESS